MLVNCGQICLRFLFVFDNVEKIETYSGALKASCLFPEYPRYISMSVVRSHFQKKVLSSFFVLSSIITAYNVTVLLWPWQTASFMRQRGRLSNTSLSLDWPLRIWEYHLHLKTSLPSGTVTCPKRYLDTGEGTLLLSLFLSCVTCCIVLATRPASSHALNEMSRDQISFSAASSGEPRLLSFLFLCQKYLPNIELKL